LSLFRRVTNLFRRSELDQEIEAELRSHIEMRTTDNIAAGMSPEEARRDALLRFGNRVDLKERVTAADAQMFLDSLWQDLCYGLRVLRKSPGFASVAILTLSLGIGTNTAIFSVIDAVLLRPLPYPRPEQLTVIQQNDSLQNLIDVQRQNHSFSQGGGINVTAMDLTGAAEPVQIHAGRVNAGFLETLGTPPMLGRILSPAEDVKGGPRNIVASYQFWQHFLNSDPGALGKTVTLSGNGYRVIGVMPASFQLPRGHADVFVSLWVVDPGAALSRDVHFMHTCWRLRPGATLAGARADLSAIDYRLAQQYPDTERGRKSILLPLHQSLVGKVRSALLVLFGAVALVLLIACANFAGLLMARGVARRRELTIRAALGAPRSRLLRQALTESALLGVIGGIAGLLLAKGGTRLLLSLRPAELERFKGIPMDAKVLLFVFGVSVLTGIVFGLAPAWSAARESVSETLKEGGRGTTAGPSSHLLHRLLITAEFALALVLLVGAGLLIKGFSRLRSVDPGFQAANVTTIYLDLPDVRYAKIPRQTQFRRELLASLNSLPGVEAAMITDIPLGGNYVGHRMVVDGRPPDPVGAEPAVQTLSVMGDYFRVMRIPIRAGRGFTPRDREGEPLVAIVNEEFVKEFLRREDPIGVRIDWARTDEPHRWMTIVGVAADVKHSGLNQPTDPAVYAPFAQNDEAWRTFMTLAIRTRGASAGLVKEVKKQVWSLDSQIPVSDVQSMDELMAVSLAQQRFNMLLLAIFAALALVLAAVGVYGLMAYGVSQRTHEIGLRMALGAQRRGVLRLVMGDGARLACAGIVIGALGALALTRLMTSLLFEVKPADPATFAAVAILLGVVALAACYIPARRAMGVDPMVALRHE
jgi:putative ABC transport system permease protein